MPLITSDTRDELADLAGDAVAAQVRHGLTEEQALDFVADVLDALIILPEPLDTGSDIAIMVGLKLIAKALRPDPDRMEERAAALVSEAGAFGMPKKRRRRMLQRAARLRKRADELRRAN